MTMGVMPFGVFDKVNNRFVEGRFFTTKEGKLKREIPVPHPDYPAMTNLFVEDVDDDNLEVKYFPPQKKE